MSLRARLNLLLLFAAPAFVVLAARLSWLQVLQGSRLESMASQEVERTVLRPQLRGRILDRNGDILAESIPSWSVFADMVLLKDAWKASEALARPLGLAPAALRQKLKTRSKFVWLKKGLDLESAEAVAKLALPGIGLRQQERRAYPNGDLTRSVLGSVGAEGQGLSGFERQFEAALRAPADHVEVVRDGKGRLIYQKGSTRPQAAQRLVLTIDRNYQYFAETALAEAVEKTQAKGGMVLAQDPSNGELLVMATAPSDPLRNPAIQDVFEPGSTLKAITALAAVETQVVRPEETFDCENGSWEMAPRVTIRDHEPEGMLTLAQIIERSSNIGIAKVVERVGPVSFYQYLRAFGFGNRTAFDYPGEAAGILKTPKQLDRVHLAQVGFGQGIAATGLQLVSAYSALANGGQLLEPRLVKGIQDDSGRWIRTYEPAVVRRVATAKGIEQVRRMLETVVETGTGKAAGVPGYSIAGKTGTSQKVDPQTGRYSRSLYTSSFIGFFPSVNPRITLLVVLDEPRRGYYGSDVAAPVFARLAKDMLAKMGVAPDREIVSKDREKQ